jgi:hypothetical protein
MHYEEHEIFTPPEDPTATIWRYMDFTKLVSLLETKSLFFARADKLGDAFEGSMPHQNVNQREALWPDVDDATARDFSNERQALAVSNVHQLLESLSVRERGAMGVVRAANGRCCGPLDVLAPSGRVRPWR